MKNWIQLRKKQIVLICALLFAEALPLFVTDLLPPKRGWAVWTAIVLSLACVMVVIDLMIPVIKEVFKRVNKK